MIKLLLFSVLCFPFFAAGQDVPSTVEQQIENITENNEDVETEDDSYLQDLAQFAKDRINLNTAGHEQLSLLRVLSPIQINSLLNYRQLLGNLINIYELQAIPGWDVETIQKILPFVTIAQSQNFIQNFRDRLHNGDHSLLLRGTRIMEEQRGFIKDTTRNYYLGSPNRIMMRYRYNFKNLLQYGITGEKDAGEEFFKGHQKQGFDFYSAHLFIRNVGIIKALAIGDYTVNLGQGLTNWMNMAFKKGPDVLAIKRQAPTIRPYTSIGEIFFFRGAAVTIGKKNWEATLFGSYKKTDANLVADTSEAEDFISSFLTSGFHRTKSEVADKGIQKQLAFGGNVKYNYKGLRTSLNAIHYQLEFPMQKRPDPYNFYALSGKSFGNYSFDYGYTYKNFHVFGELATTEKGYKALVSGLMMSTARIADLSLFYRNISPGYQGMYTSAFTENTFPTNERGLFAGLALRPNVAFTITGYADLFTFPWLKFGVNAPSAGTEYLAQFTYKPNKILEIYTRFRSETKSRNFNDGNLPSHAVLPFNRKNWRSQISYKVNTAITLRSRVELMWYDKNGPTEEAGFLLYGDFIYKPMMAKLSCNIRLGYFETDGYNSRLYAYENDVLYSYSIPVLYGNGYRYYLNLNYDISKKLALWTRIARTNYLDRNTIGSGLDRINGKHRTELKLQAMYKF